MLGWQIGWIDKKKCRLVVGMGDGLAIILSYQIYDLFVAVEDFQLV